jgi:hypothetical protein
MLPGMSSSKSRSCACGKTTEKAASCMGAERWLQLRRDGIEVARCTVERMMRELGIAGGRPGGRNRAPRCRIPEPGGQLPCWSGTSLRLPRTAGVSRSRGKMPGR